MPGHIQKKLAKLFRCSAIIFLAGLMISTPSFALSDSKLRRYADNDIIFYDPDDEDDNTPSSCINGCFVEGIRSSSGVEERAWATLRYVGFTPEQTAGMLANILHEGSSITLQETSYNTARDRGCRTQEGQEYTVYLDGYSGTSAHHAACMQAIYSDYYAGSKVAGIGLSLMQFTDPSIRGRFLELMRENNLIQYFEGDAYKTYGSIRNDDALRDTITSERGSDTDWVSLWWIVARFIKGEADIYPGFYNNSTPASYAGWWSANYERCRDGCGVGGSQYNARANKGTQIYQSYQDGAFDHLEELLSHASAGGGNSWSTSDFSTGNVTIIGDSITVGATSAIENKLPGMPSNSIHAQVSKHMVTDVSGNPSGLSIINSLGSDLKTNVVIALGTNDIGLSYNSIESVVLAIGNGHNIYFVNNYDIVRTDRYDANNSNFNEIAAVYDSVKIIDWKKAVQDAPGEPSDYVRVEEGMAVHPTTQGAELFASIIAEALESSGDGTDLCPSDNGCLPTNGFTTIENAQAKVMDAYNKLSPRNYGESTEMDAYLKKHGILNAVSCVSDLENCTAFSAWFITSYVTNFPEQTGAFLPNGRAVAEKLATTYTNYFEPGVKTTPKPYSIFSSASGTTLCDDGLPCGHTGVVLGVLNNGNIIIGEAGCSSSGISFNTAKIKTPAQYSTWKFAYPKSVTVGNCDNNDTCNESDENCSSDIHIATENVTIEIPGASQTSKVAWVSDLHIVNSDDLSSHPELQSRYDSFDGGAGYKDANGNIIPAEKVLPAIISYINNNDFDAAIFGGDIMDYYSTANAELVDEQLKRLRVPYIYIRADHDYEPRYTSMSESETHDAHRSIAGGDATCKTLSLGNVKIVGWNYSVKGFDNPYNEGLYNCITSNLGDKTIIATHVPIASSLNNNKLDDASRNKNHNDPYYWANGGSSWNIYGQVEELIGRIYDGDAAYVLAGHMHPNLNNFGGFTIDLSSNAKEHVFEAAYTAKIGVITIKP